MAFEQNQPILWEDIRSLFNRMYAEAGRWDTAADGLGTTAYITQNYGGVGQPVKADITTGMGDIIALIEETTNPYRCPSNLDPILDKPYASAGTPATPDFFPVLNTALIEIENTCGFCEPFKQVTGSGYSFTFKGSTCGFFSFNSSFGYSFTFKSSTCGFFGFNSSFGFSFTFKGAFNSFTSTSSFDGFFFYTGHDSSFGFGFTFSACGGFFSGFDSSFGFSFTFGACSGFFSGFDSSFSGAPCTVFNSAHNHAGFCSSFNGATFYQSL